MLPLFEYLLFLHAHLGFFLFNDFERINPVEAIEFAGVLGRGEFEFIETIDFVLEAVFNGVERMGGVMRCLGTKRIKRVGCFQPGI